MHILAVIMLHQHKFCVYKGKRKLKLLITCENFVLFVLLTVFILLCNLLFKKMWKKSLQSWGFREGHSGYSTHLCCCFFSPKLTNKNFPHMV